MFAYDWPGLHWGVRGDFFDETASGSPRTGEQAVEFLRGLLSDAELSPPYVLVGHSLGGQYALMYAKLYPQEIAGIVLVDSRPPNFVEACQEVFPQPAQDCVLSDEEGEGMSAPLIAEALGMLETERRLPSAEDLDAGAAGVC